MFLFCMNMFSLFIFVTFIMYVILLYAFTTPFLNKVFLELYECCEYVIESWEVQSSCSLTFTDIGNDFIFINIFSLEKVALLPLLHLLFCAGGIGSLSCTQVHFHT